MKNNALKSGKPAGKRNASAGDKARNAQTDIQADKKPGENIDNGRPGNPALMSHLYTEKQACYILGIKMKTLLQEVSAGELKFVRIGNEMRFNIADLEQRIVKSKRGIDEGNITISPTTESMGSC